MRRSHSQASRFYMVLLTMGFAALVLTGCSGIRATIKASYDAQRAYEAGLARYEAADYKAAVPHFERAVALDATFDDARAYLAWSHYRLGAYTPATRQFRLAAERQPDWAGLHDGLGWSRYQVGHYLLALEAFDHAISLDSSYRDARVGRAYTLFMLERYREAEVLLAKLIQEGQGLGSKSKATDVEPIRARHAWTLFYLGNYRGAQTQFTQGLAANPDWAGLHNGLGWALLRLGDRAQAAQSFKRALALDKNYADAKEGLTLALRK